MDFAKIAARIANLPGHRVATAMKFVGELRQGFDGENTEGEGKLFLDGVENDVVFGAAGRSPAQVTLNGQDVSDTPLAEELAEWLAGNWPEDGWVEDPNDEAWESQQATLG